jgi:flagellar hook-associated protein FlgK
MSASALFSLGTKAMTASYSALATTGHNISNANVKGYSRQLWPRPKGSSAAPASTARAWT